jgi:hypothetical protein
MQRHLWIIVEAMASMHFGLIYFAFLTDPSCNKEAKTFDGIIPFLVPGDIATPNPAYFQRVDEMPRIAADDSMIVLLDPIETSSWLDIFRKMLSQKHLNTENIWEIEIRTFQT